jgi:hypothetical protein
MVLLLGLVIAVDGCGCVKFQEFGGSQQRGFTMPVLICGRGRGARNICSWP